LGGELAVKNQDTLTANTKDTMRNATYRQLRLDGPLESVLRYDDQKSHLETLVRGE
jgi:hypothetical protein